MKSNYFSVLWQRLGNSFILNIFYEVESYLWSKFNFARFISRNIIFWCCIISLISLSFEPGSLDATYYYDENCQNEAPDPSGVLVDAHYGQCSVPSLTLNFQKSCSVRATFLVKELSGGTITVSQMIAFLPQKSLRMIPKFQQQLQLVKSNPFIANLMKHFSNECTYFQTAVLGEMGRYTAPMDQTRI